MSFVPTTMRDVVKPLQFVEEGTTAASYGVTPTSSPTFTAAGLNVEITTDPDIVSEKIFALGLEDYATSVKTQENYAFTLKSKMINTTLAKYGVNAAAGTGTIGASLSFLFSKYIDGTEYYTIMKGCRPISTSLSVARGTWDLEQIWHCKEIIDETTTHGLTTPTFASIPSGTPLSHSDAANPFTWNSTTYQDRLFKLVVTRKLAVVEINGSVLVQNTRAASRQIAWNAEVFKKSTALLTDFYDHAKRTLSYKIGASETITFTEAVIEKNNEEVSISDDPVIEKINGTAKSVTIA